MKLLSHTTQVNGAGPLRNRRPSGGGFALVEMLVSMALLAMIAAVLATVLALLSNAQKYVSGQTSSFEDASLAFQSVTRTLSQASLETYFDYFPAQNGATYTKPTNFIRQSNLHFICDQAVNLVPGATTSLNPTHAVFFQSLLGQTDNASYTAIPDLLNACGYYVSFYNNSTSIPGIPALSNNSTYRFRLMELMQPTEELEVYADKETQEPYTWISDPIQNSSGEVRPVADNIIALVIEPQYSTEDQVLAGSAQLTPDYHYDSRQNAQMATQPVNANQLPAILKVTMVAIDEASAIHLARQYGTNPPALIANGLFTSTNGNSTPSSQYDADIKTLISTLQSFKPPINYRIFVASVPLRSAKWSSQLSTN